MPELDTASTSGIQFDAIVQAFDLAGPDSLRELGEDRPMLRALLLAALAQTRSGPTDLMNSLETVDDIIGWAAVAPAPMPLSMLTTTRPGLQLWSMPRRAASPRPPRP